MLDQTWMHKTLRWTAGLSAVGFVLLFWKGILALFWFGVVTPVALFFEQDYHPWAESTADLAATWHATLVVPDSTQLRALSGITTNTSSRNCAAFAQAWDQAPSFLISEHTLCKIRVRTRCACWSGKNWVKVHISRGDKAGNDGWVCEEAIGPTVAWP